jgi:leucyl aminopeptidase
LWILGYRKLNVYRCITNFHVITDIGSPDPERMSPINAAEYVCNIAFKDADNIKVTVIEDLDVIKKEYPLAHAVTRASLAGEKRFRRYIVFDVWCSGWHGTGGTNVVNLFMG